MSHKNRCLKDPDGKRVNIRRSWLLTTITALRMSTITKYRIPCIRRALAKSDRSIIRPRPTTLVTRMTRQNTVAFKCLKKHSSLACLECKECPQTVDRVCTKDVIIKIAVDANQIIRIPTTTTCPKALHSRCTVTV
jgi:hypothetical protein